MAKDRSLRLPRLSDGLATGVIYKLGRQAPEDRIEASVVGLAECLHEDVDRLSGTLPSSKDSRANTPAS